MTACIHLVIMCFSVLFNELKAAHTLGNDKSSRLDGYRLKWR